MRSHHEAPSAAEPQPKFGVSPAKTQRKFNRHFDRKGEIFLRSLAFARDDRPRPVTWRLGARKVFFCQPMASKICVNREKRSGIDNFTFALVVNAARIFVAKISILILFNVP